MGTADDWARGISQRIKTKQDLDERAAETVRMNREIVAEQGPLAWEELWDQFQKHCDAYNRAVNPKAKLYSHRLGNHEIIVRPDVLEPVITARYGYETKSITIETKTGSVRYLPTTVHVGLGKAQYQSSATGQITSVESMVRTAIDEAMV